MTELTDRQKTKVFIIEDINKLYALYKGEVISVKVFDILYDLPVNKLQRAFVNIRDVFEREALMKNLHNELNGYKNY